MTKNKIYDAIIIGGSYTGLSAAMALGRSLKTVLIIDSSLACNRQTPYSHNFITQDGEKPADIAQKAKQQLSVYKTVEFLNDLAINASQIENGFIISTQNKSSFSAKKIIFATGVKDIMPDIKGFAECWGISAIHCPYCHGYELRNQPTGIIANEDAAIHYAQLIKNLTENMVIFTESKANFSAEQLEKLQKHKIPIIENKIEELIHTNGNLEKVILTDGRSFSLKAIYHRPSFEQHCKLPEMLGCEMTETGLLKVDAMQNTSVKGIYACGDSASPMRSVANAVATGTQSGTAVNASLSIAEF